MVTYWDRLRPELDANKLTRQQFADAIGVSYQAVKKVADGGALGSTNNLKAAQLLKVNPLWLATGRGPKTGFNLSNLQYAGQDYVPPMQRAPPALPALAGGATPVSPALGVEAIAQALALMTDEQREAIAGG